MRRPFGIVMIKSEQRIMDALTSFDEPVKLKRPDQESLKNYEVAMFLRDFLESKGFVKKIEETPLAKKFDIDGWKLDFSLYKMNLRLEKIIRFESPSGLVGDLDDWIERGYESNPWDLLSGKEQQELRRILK